MQKQPTHLPDRLNDPKLPVIHAKAPGNGMQQHRSEAPLPQASQTLQDLQ